MITVKSVTPNAKAKAKDTIQIAKAKAVGIIEAAKAKAAVVIEKAKNISSGKSNAKIIIGVAKEKSKALLDAAKVKAKGIVENAKMCNNNEKLKKNRKNQHGGQGSSYRLVVISDIADLDKMNSAVHHLKIHFGKTVVAQIDAIVRALSKITGLITLDLSENDIGPDGAAAIAPTLKSMKALTTLNLRSNSIGVEGAQAISDAIKLIPKMMESRIDPNRNIMIDNMMVLKILDLSQNQLGDKGVAALAQVLPFMRKLHTLNLRSNNIGVEGAKAISDAIQLIPDVAITRGDTSYIIGKLHEYDKIDVARVAHIARYSAIGHFANDKSMMIFGKNLAVLHLEDNNIGDKDSLL